MTLGIRALRWRPFRLTMHGRFEAASGAIDHRHGVLIELVEERKEAVLQLVPKVIRRGRRVKNKVSYI